MSVKKPSFFFGDSLAPDDDLQAVETEQWIYETDGELFFLPPIQRSHSLGYLHHLSVPRHIDWELVRVIHGLPVGRLEGLSMSPQIEDVFGLFPGYAQRGYPAGEIP